MTPDSTAHDAQTPKMTREELLKILRTDSGDAEGDHQESDRALLAYINDPEITAAFDERTKRYA